MRRPTVVRGSLVARIERFAPNLRGTTRSTIGPDLIAGLTVAALAVPQGLAYALVAGLPPQMGLLAAAIPAIVAALMGSSPYLVTGPTNPIALVLAVAITVPALASGAPVPVGEVLATGLLAGVLLLGFGLFGLGRASRFLSDSVIVGFATGAGLLIALRLLPSLAVGGEPPGAESVAWHPLAPKVWPLLVEAGRAIGASDARALTLALAVPATTGARTFAGWRRGCSGVCTHASDPSSRSRGAGSLSGARSCGSGEVSRANAECP